MDGVEINVIDFGAKGDGTSYDAQAIQAAIDYAANRGGKVVVPPGVYLCGTIRLKSNVELHLREGAILKASERIEDYNSEDEYIQNFSSAKEEWRGLHLLLFVEQHDVTLSGKGVIDGSGDAFFGEPTTYGSPYIWKNGLALAKDKEKLRPGQTVCFIECQNVKIEGVSVRNATCWAFFLHGCDRANVRGVSVHNPPYYANTDGIDIDSCSSVDVSGCVIDTGDDAIAIRGASRRLKNKDKKCEHITVSDCVLASSSSVIRIGIGQSEIRHIRISDIVIKRGGIGLNVLSAAYGRNHTPINDVRCRNIEMQNTSRPFMITANEDSTISDFVIENFRSETESGALICSESKTAIFDVRLSNVELIEKTFSFSSQNAEDREAALLQCKGIDGLQLQSVCIRSAAEKNSEMRQTIEIRDCTRVVSNTREKNS